MFFPIEEWAPAFALTVIAEAVVVVLALRRQVASLFRLALLCLFANLATHPIVWFVIPQLVLPGTTAYTAVAETWAVAAEALFYWAAVQGVRARRAFLVSLAANATSFVLGRLIGGVLAGAS